MDKGKKINWKNGLLLSAVSYLLYIIIWLVLDYETARQLPEMALIDYMVDFLLCMLFTYTSLGFCYIVFNVFPFSSLMRRMALRCSSSRTSIFMCHDVFNDGQTHRIEVFGILYLNLFVTEQGVSLHDIFMSQPR